jgi:hypothetical protein
MPRTVAHLLALATLSLLAGCGDSGSASSKDATSTSPPASTLAAKKTTRGGTSRYVVVTSLLGKPLPKEPGCRFARNFVPDNPSAAAYDGALTLTVTCEKTKGYTAVGQVVNRPGSKPTEITCRDTTAGQLYCIYVPSSTVGLYFTGTDRAVVRRRLEHLMEIVAPLPTGITPLSGTSSP